MTYVRNVGGTKRSSVNSKLRGRRTLLFGLVFVFAVAFGVQRATIGNAKLSAFAGNVPNAPINLSAVAVSTSAIALQWQDTSSDETGFQIERCLGASCTNFSSITTVSTNSTSFTNTGLLQGTTYSYRVAAVGRGGKLSAYTNIASSTTLASLPASTPTPTPTPPPSGVPVAPSNLVATGVSSSQINLTWTDNSTNESGFKIYRCQGSLAVCGNPGSGGYVLRAYAAAGGTSYSDTSASSGVTYVYAVQAYNSYGDSAYSNGAQATAQSGSATPTPTPTTPGNLVATAVSISQINLTWTDNSTNESGFRVDRALLSTGPWTQVGDLIANTTSLGNASLSANTLYYYRVYAYNSSGNSAYSNIASATTLSQTPTPTPTPAAPSATAATNVTSSSFTANWSSSSGATGYQLDVSTSSAFGTFVSGYQNRDVGNALSFSGSGLSASTTYYYRLRAYNTGGTSGNSNMVSATTGAAPTPTPSGSPWSKGFGSANNDAGQAVEFDSGGNLYATGYFQGTVNFGGNCGALTSNGSSYPDAYLAKYSPSGTCLWAKGFGGTLDDAGYGVAVDSSDNVVVAGDFAGTADFGGGAVTGQPGYNIFVAKYGSDGRYQWSKTYGSPSGGTNLPYSVAVDSSGNVGLTGQFQYSIDFGGGSLTGNGSFQDVFVLKLSAGGGYLWSKGFGGSFIDMGRGIAFDPSGNVVVVGTFWYTIDVGCGTLTSAGGDEIFVVKYSPSGGCLWAKRFGDSADQEAMGVAVDFAGNIAITGSFKGTLNFGGSDLVDTYFAQPDIYVVELNASGGHVWSKSFGTMNSDQGRAVAVDTSGNVVITGYFLGTIDFGGGPVTSSGGLNTFVAKYSSGGAHLRSQGFTGSNQSWGVATDGNGNIGVTGYFQGTMTTDQGSLTAVGGLDSFLYKRAQ